MCIPIYKNIETHIIENSAIETHTIENRNGNTYYYNYGVLHRTETDPITGLVLPAVIYENGDKEWWKDGCLCRDDLNFPEKEYSNGDLAWVDEFGYIIKFAFANGDIEDYDGRFRVKTFANGDKEYYLENMCFKKELADGTLIDF